MKSSCGNLITPGKVYFLFDSVFLVIFVQLDFLFLMCNIHVYACGWIYISLVCGIVCVTATCSDHVVLYTKWWL